MIELCSLSLFNFLIEENKSLAACDWYHLPLLDPTTNIDFFLGILKSLLLSKFKSEKCFSSISNSASEWEQCEIDDSVIPSKYSGLLTMSSKLIYVASRSSKNLYSLLLLKISVLFWRWSKILLNLKIISIWNTSQVFIRVKIVTL